MIDRKKLLSSLATIGPFVGDGDLANINLIAKNGRLVLSAFNAEAGLNLVFPQQISIDDFSVAVNFYELRSRLRKTASPKISFSVDMLDCVFTVQTEKRKLFDLEIGSPCFPENESHLFAFSVDAGKFKTVAKELAPHVSTDPTKNILNSVHVKSDGDNILLYSTDGHSACRSKLSCESTDGTFQEMTVSPLILRMINKSPKGKIRVEICNDRVWLTHSDWSGFAKQVLGIYPQVDQVIPSNHQAWLTCDTDTLRDVLKQSEWIARIRASFNNQSVLIDFKGKKDEEYRNEVELKCHVMSTKIFAFGQPMLKALNGIEESKVTLKTFDSSDHKKYGSNAVLIDTQSSTIIVMPFQIQNEKIDYSFDKKPVFDDVSATPTEFEQAAKGGQVISLHALSQSLRNEAKTEEIDLARQKLESMMESYELPSKEDPEASIIPAAKFDALYDSWQSTRQPKPDCKTSAKPKLNKPANKSTSWDEVWPSDAIGYVSSTSNNGKVLLALIDGFRLDQWQDIGLPGKRQASQAIACISEKGYGITKIDNVYKLVLPEGLNKPRIK